MHPRQFLKTAAHTAAALPFASIAFAGGAQPIRPDRGGMLRVRGKRAFILGLYQVPKHEGALREASEAGFNLINRSATRAAYDEAQALGLWGWSALGSLPPANRADGFCGRAAECLFAYKCMDFTATTERGPPTFYIKLESIFLSFNVVCWKLDVQRSSFQVKPILLTHTIVIVADESSY